MHGGQPAQPGGVIRKGLAGNGLAVQLEQPAQPVQGKRIVGENVHAMLVFLEHLGHVGSLASKHAGLE